MLYAFYKSHCFHSCMNYPKLYECVPRHSMCCYYYYYFILFYFLLLLKIGLRDDSFRNNCRNTALYSSNLSLLQPLLITETKHMSFYAATYDDNRCCMHFTNHTRHWQSIPDKYHCNQSINQSIKFLWCQFLYAYGISRWCTSCLELDQCP